MKASCGALVHLLCLFASLFFCLFVCLLVAFFYFLFFFTKVCENDLWSLVCDCLVCFGDTSSSLCSDGPDSAGVSDPGTFDLHPTTPGTMTLTCTAVTYTPGVTYSWTGACSGVTDSTCSFTPTISDNGDVISCTATNNVTGVSASSSQTLVIQCELYIFFFFSLENQWGNVLPEDI